MSGLAGQWRGSCQTHCCRPCFLCNMMKAQRTRFLGMHSCLHTCRRKKNNSFWASVDPFHISTGILSGPTVLPSFMRFIAVMNSSKVRSSVRSRGSRGLRSLYRYRSRASSSSVTENLLPKKSAHSSPSSSADVIKSPYLFRVGWLVALVTSSFVC